MASCVYRISEAFRIKNNFGEAVSVVIQYFQIIIRDRIYEFSYFGAEDIGIDSPAAYAAFIRFLHQLFFQAFRVIEIKICFDRKLPVVG